MNKDIKLRLLLLPFIFMVLLFVPAMIFDIALDVYFLGGGVVLSNPCVVILGISLLIWAILFHYIPTSVYIAIVAVYTAVSWTWILRQKKGNAVYFIVWFVLCVLSIFMYWKWGPEYYMMIHG